MTTNSESPNEPVRYELVNTYNLGGAMLIRHDGQWVRYTDYAALSESFKEHSRLTAERIAQLNNRIELQATSLKTAEDLCAGLEAERDTAQSELAAARKELRNIRAGYARTVEYDLSPAMVESAIRDKLIELGWTPPIDAARTQDAGKGKENG